MDKLKKSIELLAAKPETSFGANSTFSCMIRTISPLTLAGKDNIWMGKALFCLMSTHAVDDLRSILHNVLFAVQCVMMTNIVHPRTEQRLSATKLCWIQMVLLFLLFR